MPRASYGDRYTITVMHGESHVVFDFTSKVVDFVAFCDSDRLGSGDAIGKSIALETSEIKFSSVSVCCPALFLQLNG